MSFNTYELHILGKDEQERKLRLDQEVALYHGGLLGDNWHFIDVLQKLDIKLHGIKRIQDIDKSDYLIIGRNALDDNVTAHAELLKNWLKQGGRLLCMEQAFEGKIPWLPELEIRPLRVRIYLPSPPLGIDVDIVEREHPVFEGIAGRKYWSIWNLPYGEIYRSLLMPMDEDVIASAGELRRTGRPMVYGMVIAEKKLGKGLCIFSQVEATRACEHGDGVALKYLHNLVEHFLIKN